jgi:hypothetical protein
MDTKRSDKDRILELLETQGSVTSFYLRKQGFSGNPSQRIKELIDAGHQIQSERYEDSPGRYGARYALVKDAQIALLV